MDDYEILEIHWMQNNWIQEGIAKLQVHLFAKQKNFCAGLIGFQKSQSHRYKMGFGFRS